MTRLVIIFEILALIVGLSAVILFTSYLLTDYQACIIIVEPVVWIRLTEVFMGIVAVPFLLNLINSKIKALSQQ